MYTLVTIVNNTVLGMYFFRFQMIDLHIFIEIHTVKCTNHSTPLYEF